MPTWTRFTRRSKCSTILRCAGCRSSSAAAVRAASSRRRRTRRANSACVPRCRPRRRASYARMRSFVPGRMNRYVEISRVVRRVFESFSPVVEPLSLDEAFIDLTGTERLLGPADRRCARSQAPRARRDRPGRVGRRRADQDGGENSERLVEARRVARGRAGNSARVPDAVARRTAVGRRPRDARADA